MSKVSNGGDDKYSGKYDATTPLEAPEDVDEEKVPTRVGTLRELFQYAELSDYFAMFIGSIGGIVTGLSLPAFNVMFGRMLDALNDNPESFGDRIEEISLIFVYIAIANLFSGVMQVGGWTVAGERTATQFRERYVKAILSQEIGWFDVNGPSEMATKVADASGIVQDGLTRKASDLFQFMAQFIGSFVVALYLCWQLTVVLLAAFPMIGAAGAFMISAITDATTGAGENYATAGGVATESLSNIRTVTALNAQPDIISRYRIYLLEAMHIGITKGAKVGAANGGLFCAAFLTYSLGFWYGGKLVADNRDDGNNDLTGGTVLSVFFCVIMGSIALGQVVPPITAFIGAKTSVGPMLEIIEREPEINGFSDEGIVPKGATEGCIELKDITFAYPSRPDINVCKNYSLSIKPGETVALVGASGSGKSTIINLLLRFYDPQQGSISLDGNELRALNIKYLRNQIGLVSQEPILFSGTIRDNIGYGLKGSDMDKEKIGESAYNAMIEEAAKQANAHDFISDFPEGYNTDVGTGGVAMSGGQKQRIAIARALVKKPALLLLDEATSALDAASEKLVQASIDALQASHAQTTIVVAHRLSTIRNADKIALVNQGSIAELGSHDQLIAKKGLYADLVSLQMDEEDDSEGNDKEEFRKTEESSSSALLAKSASGDADDKEAEKEEEEEPISEAEASLLTSNIQAMLMKHPIYIALAFLGSAAFGAMFPCWGLLLARTQDMFYETDTDKLREEAATLSLWYILLASIALIFCTLQFWGSAEVCERVSMRLRSEFFEAILRREVGYFDPEENSAGALITRLAEDSRSVTRAMGENVPRQLQAVFTLAVGLGLGMSASWKIALVVLATFPVTIAASAIQMMAFAGQQYDTSNSSSSAGSVISTAFNHMRTVTSFSMQYQIADEFNTITALQTEERMKTGFVGGFGFGCAQATTFGIYALLFWYGSTLIEKDEVNFEDMMTAIMSLMLGALGLGQAFGDLADQNVGLKAAKRIFDAMRDAKDSPIDGLSSNGEKPEERAQGKIELRGVNFRYPTRPDVEVCKDYNLTINPGEVVALVGPSGSGKSTIMNLLLRFYDPFSGEVLLDGKNIKDVNVRWLRSQIGYVGQEPVLFSGTIAGNVAKGRTTYGDAELMTLDQCMALSDENARNGVNTIKETKELAFKAGFTEGSETPAEDIVEATKKSNAHQFISGFTEGYKTDVGEGSIMVSGGQKQRIAIARALIKKPAVLLLDEATSALDAASEKMVQESIDELQKGKAQTTIVIAHRLTTIKNADKIAVIDKGAVVAVGTHDQLLSDENGLYYTLWNKQQGRKGTKSSDNLAAMVGK